MRRRDFIGALGAAATLPFAVRAQEPSKKIPKIGVLWGGEQQGANVARYVAAFREGLHALGYVEGRTIIVDDRFVEQYSQFDSVAVELVQSKVDVLVATSTPTALAAKRATTTIPVVFAYATDPVGLKLVNNLARPGGNVTGLSAMTFDLMPKQLELLNDTVPNMRTIAVLYDPQIPAFEKMVEAYEHAAGQLKLAAQIFQASSSNDLESTFDAIAQDHPGGLVIAPSLVFYRERKQIAALALENDLATMAWLVEITMAGGLMSYGVDEIDLYRRAAAYVDQILKGEKPADLPVQQPTKFDLVLNARTAKALGLIISDRILALADEVIN